MIEEELFEAAKDFVAAKGDGGRARIDAIKALQKIIDQLREEAGEMGYHYCFACEREMEAVVHGALWRCVRCGFTEGKKIGEMSLSELTELRDSLAKMEAAGITDIIKSAVMEMVEEKIAELQRLN